MTFYLLKKKIKNYTLFLFEKQGDAIGHRWMEKYQTNLEVGKTCFLHGYGDVKILSIRTNPKINIKSFFNFFKITPSIDLLIGFSYSTQGLPSVTSLSMKEFLSDSIEYLNFENELSKMIENYKQNPIK